MSAMRNVANEDGLPAASTTDIDAQGRVISKWESELVHSDPTCRMISLSERTPEGLGLPFRAQTMLAAFRTDLDAPLWQEIHALMLHGATIAAKVIDGKLSIDDAQEKIRSTNLQILVQAGDRMTLPSPRNRICNEATEDRCSA